MKPSKVRRVSKEDVKNNAQKGAGGASWFTLPKGVEQWAPEEAGKVTLDFLPYVVTSKNHPDKIEPGTLWYKHPFAIHHGVGPSNESIVCPTTLGKPCPLCQDRAKLAKNDDANEEDLKALNAQKYVAYIIKNPDDEDKIAVFAMSRGKFAAVLEKELDETDEDVLLFWDTTEEGKTMTVRFGKEKYAGRTFLQASRIDFVDRKALDEEEILAAVPCLDDIFNVMEYDKLKALYLQLDAEDDDALPAAKKKPATKDDDDDETPTKPTKKSAAKEPDPEDGQEYKVGDTVKFEEKGEEFTGKITDIDDDDVTVEDSEGDEHVVDMDDIEAAEEEETKPTKNGKTETKPEPKTEGKFKKGDKVTYTLKGKEYPGTIVEVDEDDITVEDKDGEEHDVDIDDVKSAAGGKSKSKEPAEVEVGSQVSWDKGTHTGEVVKIHSTNGKAKVKDEDDDEVWVPVDELEVVAE